MYVLHLTISFMVYSSPPSATYMRRWTGSALVQAMTCCLFGAKPLPEPVLTYCQLDPWKKTSVKVESKNCSFMKMRLKLSSAKWRPFCSGGDELIHWLLALIHNHNKQWQSANNEHYSWYILCLNTFSTSLIHLRICVVVFLCNVPYYRKSCH